MAHLHAVGYTDLTLNHVLNVLRFVSADGIRPARIADQVGITQQAISLLLSDLVARGYVERTPDPSDRRAQLIRWSPKGLAAATAIESWFTELEQSWREQCGNAAVDAAVTVLTQACITDAAAEGSR